MSAPLSLIDPPAGDDARRLDGALGDPLPGWVDVELPLAWDDAAHTLVGRAPTAECPYAVVGAWRLEWETGTVQQSTTQFVVVRRASPMAVDGPLPLTAAVAALNHAWRISTGGARRQGR